MASQLDEGHGATPPPSQQTIAPPFPPPASPPPADAATTVAPVTVPTPPPRYEDLRFHDGIAAAGGSGSAPRARPNRVGDVLSDDDEEHDAGHALTQLEGGELAFHGGDATDSDLDDESRPIIAGHRRGRPAASAERGMSRRACCGFSVAACGAFALLVFFVWVSDVPTHGFSAEDVHASVDVDFSKQMCVLRRRTSYTRASEALQDDGTPLWMTDPHRAFVTATLFPLPTTVRRMDGKEVGTGPMASAVMGQTLRLVQGEEVIRPVTEVALLSRSLLSFCHRFVPGNHSDVRRRPHASPTVMTIGAVEVKAARPAASSYPQFGMDESYTLRINAPVVTIEAAEVWGVMRAMETFSQLVMHDGTVLGMGYEIVDQPRFPWRGFLIDTARHFMPVRTILRTLDGMAHSKFNTLHWHFVDGQSFPLLLKSHPELATKGAFSSDKVYTPADVQEVVNYARGLGIRVVPEVDGPSHAAAWGPGIPGMVANCSQWAYGDGTYYKALDKIALNPVVNVTYEVLEDVFNELASMFPDDFVHIGMDEVQRACWTGRTSGISSEQLAAWTAETGISPSYENLLNYFHHRVAALVKHNGKRMVAWQDTYDHVGDTNIDPTVAIQPWMCWANRGDMALSTATNAHRGVLQSMCWYLDYESTWVDYYHHDPFPSKMRITDDQKQLVWGGEITMFAESVDATNFDCRVWPRAAAVAERFWSDQEVTSPERAAPRLAAHRERLVRLGIAAASFNPANVDRTYREDGNGRCPSLPQPTQRPANPAYHTFVQYNIDEGGKARQDRLLNWLRDTNAEVVGLCEANGWGDRRVLQSLVHTSSRRGGAPSHSEMRSLNTNVNDPKAMASRAAKAGYPYATLFAVKSGYSIAMLAVHPIKVVEQNDQDFERGMLIVKVHGIHYIVVHLDAHSSEDRLVEANIVASRVTALTAAGETVVVMGDMNTLSPRDQEWHREEKLVEFLQDERVPSRLTRKYMHDGQLDYRPMEALLHAGLTDMCTMTHWPEATTAVPHPAPSPCLFTEPTAISMVASLEGTSLKVPPFRLDYALGNGRAVQLGMHCAVVQTPVTDHLSDHYPVACRFARSAEEDAHGFDWRL